MIDGTAYICNLNNSSNNTPLLANSGEIIASNWDPKHAIFIGLDSNTYDNEHAEPCFLEMGKSFEFCVVESITKKMMSLSGFCCKSSWEAQTFELLNCNTYVETNQSQEATMDTVKSMWMDTVKREDLELI